MRSRERLVPAVAGALLAAAIGCQLLVPNEIPAFACADVSPSSCPDGMTCDLATRSCVADAGAAPETSLDGPVVEDGGEDADGAPERLPPGAPCRVDGDCRTNLCGTSTILTTVVTRTAGPICTSPCCTSADCADGFVCFGGGTGGNYCVPAESAGREPPSGGAKPGATCASARDCRSGICELADGGIGRCLDTCCEPSDCLPGTECRLKSVAVPAPAHVIWACSPAEPSGNKDAGQACVENHECKSDACTGYPARVCRAPCANTATCKQIPGFEDGHCVYAPNGNDYFRSCLSPTTATDKATGQPCTDNAECRSDYCDAELRRCLDVCATDGDCPRASTCRPSAVNTPYLRCVPLR